MQNNNQHILHRVNLEITTESESQAFAIKEQVDVFIKNQFFPQLESLFDALVPVEEIRRFETLELSLHLKSITEMISLKDQLVSQLHEKIEFAASTMGTQVDSHSNNLQSPDQKRNNENILLCFLNTGQLPWFARPSTFQDYIESGTLFKSLQNKSFIQRLKKQFSVHNQSITRFIQQFDKKHIEELIIQLTGENKINRQKFHIRISKQDIWIKNSLYFLIISKLIQKNNSGSMEPFHELILEIHAKSSSNSVANRKIKQIQEILSIIPLNNSINLTHQIPEINDQPKPFEINNRQHNLTANPESGKNSPEISIRNIADLESEENIDDDQDVDLVLNATNKKSVYIENAGLILAHPFLWDLFSRTKCTDDLNSLLPDKKDLAVHILHFLATGREQEMEYNLTFEKFLCGIPLDSPVAREVILSDQSKIECNDLLLSMIRFWPELKNTSPDGLRQMFLQRSGKLDLEKPPYKLHIERRAQDVLLEHLQWNISIVKLPWIQELLFTEW